MAFTNGDFETGDLTGWTPNNTGHPTVVGSGIKAPHGGVYCLEVTYNGMGEAEADRQAVREGPFYFTSSAAQIDISYWHAAGTLDGGGTDYAPVRGSIIRFYNLDDTLADDPWNPGTPYVWENLVSGATDTDWHYKTQGGTTDYGPGYFMLELIGASGRPADPPYDPGDVNFGDPGDTLYYDDVSLAGDFTDTPPVEPGGERTQVIWVGL